LASTELVPEEEEEEDEARASLVSNWEARGTWRLGLEDNM